MNFDIVITGGGMAGASLAAALIPAGLNVAIVEAVPLESAEQPSFDERTVALTYSSRRIFEGIGVWNTIAPDATPIREIHVSDRGHFGMTRLHHRLMGVDALGYVVPHRIIGAVLHEFLRGAGNVSIISPATVTHAKVSDHVIEISLQSESQTRNVTAKLMVVADGGRSSISNELGIKSNAKKYPQVALVTTIKTSQEHHGMAYERFTQDGPLALLPLREKEYAVVWTLRPTRAEINREVEQSEFLQALQDIFGERAGEFQQCGSRNIYSLSLNTIENPVQHRVVVAGNAAHTVHPVAGQGFNLSLRDIASLAETIATANDKSQDIGALPVLQSYATQRKRETQAVTRFTDSLISTFANQIPGLTFARNTALTAVQLLPPLKRFLLQRTMGLNRPSSRLAMGLPLNSTRD